MTELVGVGGYPAFEIVILLISSVVGGLISGLGGAGGPLVMASLLSVLDLPPPQVAGTSSTIFIGGAFAAGSAYIYSGDVNWKIVVVMVPPVLLGTQTGVYLNQFLSTDAFSVVLALLLVGLGGNLLYREFRELRPILDLDVDTYRGKGLLALVAFGTGVFSGTTGFGGPGIIIPFLLVFGIPPLFAIGSGIVQGMFITTVTSASYILSGNVDFVLVMVSGIPFFTSAILGWKVAQHVDGARLKVIIGVFLILLAPYVVVMS